MKNYDLLIFDMDGTLIDSFPGILTALNRALEELHLPGVDLQWVRRHVGRGASKLIASASGGRIEPEDLHRVFRRHYGEAIVEQSRPFPGVEDTLKNLGKDHRLGLASNKPDRWIFEVLEDLEWKELFCSIMGPEAAGAHKPHPEMIDKILRECAIPKERSILIGDMPIDAETGKNAGIPVLGVSCGAAEPEELLDAGCIEVLSSVVELPTWLIEGE